MSYAVSIVRMKSVKGRHKSARSKTKRPASENEYSVENIAPLVPWLFKSMVFSAKAMDPLVKIKARDIGFFLFSIISPDAVYIRGTNVVPVFLNVARWNFPVSHANCD